MNNRLPPLGRRGGFRGNLPGLPQMLQQQQQQQQGLSKIWKSAN